MSKQWTYFTWNSTVLRKEERERKRKERERGRERVKKHHFVSVCRRQILIHRFDGEHFIRVRVITMQRKPKECSGRAHFIFERKCTEKLTFVEIFNYNTFLFRLSLSIPSVMVLVLSVFYVFVCCVAEWKNVLQKMYNTDMQNTPEFSISMYRMPLFYGIKSSAIQPNVICDTN